MTKEKIDNEKLKEIRRSAPSIIVGKGGWKSIIEEFKRQIKRNKIIKIKLLKSAKESIDKEDIAQKIAEATESELIEIRGNTIVYFKKNF